MKRETVKVEKFEAFSRKLELFDFDLFWKATVLQHTEKTTGRGEGLCHRGDKKCNQAAEGQFVHHI